MGNNLKKNSFNIYLEIKKRCPWKKREYKKNNKSIGNTKGLSTFYVERPNEIIIDYQTKKQQIQSCNY